MSNFLGPAEAKPENDQTGKKPLDVHSNILHFVMMLHLFFTFLLFLNVVLNYQFVSDKGHYVTLVM